MELHQNLNAADLRHKTHVAPLTQAERLRYLHKLIYPLLAETHEARVRRMYFLQSIANLAEDGQIAVVWSGRDCDGVSYAGEIRLVEANKDAVEKHINDTFAWADGPCGYVLMAPSAAEEIEYQSRDLTLEAFEDGHPHVLYG